VIRETLKAGEIFQDVPINSNKSLYSITTSRQITFGDL
jgi:hypothetical protein